MSFKARFRQWLGDRLTWFGPEPVEGEQKPGAGQATLEAIEAKIGYQFRDRANLKHALLHRSHIHVAGSSRQESNERLEFLGDAVLGLVVNEHLYHRFPRRAEGDLTKMKSLLVCGTRLSEIAAQLDLGLHIRMSRSEAANGGRKRTSILADSMEALIGAVYLDGGLSEATGVIARCLLDQSAGILSKRSLGNYKSRLQELIQAKYKSPPRYRVLRASGPDHARTFTVGVVFNGVILGSGQGHNKKAAEQKAAQEALTRLQQEPDLLDFSDE